MTTIAEKRDFLKSFIREGIDKRDLNRAEGDEYFLSKFRNDDDNDDLEKVINRFLKFNDKCIDESSDDRIIFLHQLTRMINNGECQNMDKESMVSFTTSGFCFRKDNRSDKAVLVVFNER